MYSTNIANAQVNLNSLVDMATLENQLIHINAESGNTVLMSEKDYNGLIETLYLCSNPTTRDEIIEGLKTPVEDCEELDWDSIN